MENIFLVAGIIAVIFLIAKFIEMRFIEKENKPLKLLIRDTILVYLCIVIGLFTIDQLKPVINVENVSPAVFTDNPTF
jgi:hypothetical protein